ncbi:MAG: (2Fe-2S)-binding protein [Actinomycetota bacterium]|nr:(2Fe-2S)-binding protein [Actinomycetota bacterium]
MLTDSVVRDLAAFGPFFAVQTHSPGSLPCEPWQAMNELVEDPGVLMDRVAAVRSRLAAAGGRAPDGVEIRVAASVTHLGLVARLVSPALAVAVISGELLEIDDLASTRWQRVVGGAFPLSVPQPVDTDAGSHHATPEPTPGRLAYLLASRVLDGPVHDLVEATVPLSVSRQVLWGNVASAVNGAATMIATGRPAWANRSRMIASLLLDQPPLSDTSVGSAAGGFRRRSCCLIYRAAPNAAGAVCGDCVLSSDPPS